MTDRHGKRVGGVIRRWDLIQAQNCLHHPLYLSLVGAAVAAGRLLDPSRRILEALNAGQSGGDENGAARLPDRERDAGVGADVGLFERNGIGLLAGNQLAHSFEESPQAKLQPRAGRRSPPTVVESLKAVCVSLDDAVPACSRAGIDAENFHDETLGRVPDGAAGGKKQKKRGAGPTPPSVKAHP